MKKGLALGALLLALATPAFAGLDLGWNDCITDGGVSDIVLPCTGLSSAVLYGNFQLVGGISQFIALDISLDVQTQTDPSGDFWNFGGGECSDGNLTLDDGRFGDCLSTDATMCFATGAYCQNGFTWASQFGGTNRHRIVGSLFRDARDPVALAGGTNYFAFKFSFFTCNAVEGGGACVGCTDPATIVWNSALATGLRVGGGAETEPIEGPGLVSNCAAFNGGTSLCSAHGESKTWMATEPLNHCGVTATASKSWGQIKSLYR